ncbi:uncharacterized protein I206_107359 [Kwoniella pini CBS 10737]|uniref:Uncharacterized protein n=1 Tax=Kwoniella pini CBS 10737 TaxID=1296096 RepID=A0A1B9HX30_9TREE|nr:uncharacterized protein I206_05685 [Kwoniella pini CBS 10737]OCF47825.1 hypothetical protein I206_05685 [Kwoniella pini CBS 10737]
MKHNIREDHQIKYHPQNVEEEELECPSPNIKSSKYPYPLDIQMPSTPNIPTLNLPIPLIKISPHTPSESRKIKLLSSSQTLNLGEGSIPNSLKDLKSLTNSIGNSTLKPSFSYSENTIRPSLNSISFETQLKALNPSFLKSLINSSSSSTKESQSNSTNFLNKSEKRVIDEINFEWCFHCGKEFLRNEMILKEVDLNIEIKKFYNQIYQLNHENNEFDNKNNQLGKSLQWVCKEC